MPANTAMSKFQTGCETEITNGTLIHNDNYDEEFKLTKKVHAWVIQCMYGGSYDYQCNY